MNICEAKAKLDEMGVPESVYTFSPDRTVNEKLCLSHDEATGRWQVWYSERGQRTGLKEFASEDEACRNFVKTLEWDATK